MSKVNNINNNSAFNRSHTARNAIICSAVGAGAVSLREYKGQKLLIKYGDPLLDEVMSSTFFKRMEKETISDSKDILRKMIESKKTWKTGIIISGAMGAAALGGLYLIGHSIKNLILGNKK